MLRKTKPWVIWDKSVPLGTPGVKKICHCFILLVGTMDFDQTQAIALDEYEDETDEDLSQSLKTPASPYFNYAM